MQGKWEGRHYDSDVQAYLCHFSPRPGKLDVDKCVELGIKPGPVLGKLKSGQDVTLDDGRFVFVFVKLIHDTNTIYKEVYVDIGHYIHNTILSSLQNCQEL